VPDWLLSAALAVVPSVAVSQAPASPHDVTTYPVVYRVAGMADVLVRPDLPYAAGQSGPLHVDLYVPPRAGMGGEKTATGFPVVIFANGVGDGVVGKLKSWEIYRSWARLMAAHGVAAVTMEAEPGRTAQNIAEVVDYVRRHGHEQGLDPDRIALWACSANVSTALPYAMGASPLRAAVFYYGTATVSALRKDLPVFYVMSGRDAPPLIDGIRRLWASAAQQDVPWTMVLARDMPHAFDALVESAASRQLVQDTVSFLARQLAPGEPAPEVPPARDALTHAFGWEWKQAADAYGRMVADDPRDREARRQHARALRQTGRARDAIGELRKAIELGDDAGVRLELAGLLLAEKQFDDAVAEYDAAIARGGAAGVAQYNAACALALAGRTDAALDRLEKALAAGFASRERIESDADLSSLRSHPRYRALLDRR
jgi:tetratricopeptide (TPR) repeat protein